MTALASATFRAHPDPAVRELARVVELLENDARVLRRELAAVSSMRVVETDYTTLTDDSVSVITTWQDYGAETLTFDQPDRASVRVFGLVTAWATATGGTSRRVADIRVGISLDGGSTFTFGEMGRGDTDRSAADIRDASQTAFHFVEGEPTGTIVVKAQIQQPSLGVAGDLTWTDGSLYGTVNRIETEGV